MAERSAEEIQADIERARLNLASTVDELAYRTSPKRVAQNLEAALSKKLQTQQGRAIAAALAALLVLIVLRRIFKR